VLDGAVSSLPIVDSLVQPLARYSASFRTLNGLFGPPVMVASIVMDGENGWAHDPQGRMLFTEDGRPVPTHRTAMKFQMLRYSLVQMARTADVDKVRERAQENAERMRQVDDLIDYIFSFPPRQAPPQPQPGQDGPVPQHAQPFTYPSPPVMDDAGAAVP